jgi:hypothetical protein
LQFNRFVRDDLWWLGCRYVVGILHKMRFDRVRAIAKVAESGAKGFFAINKGRKKA